MLKKYKLGLPQAIVFAVAVASLAMVLTFAPEDTRSVVVEWLGWAFAGVASFLGPMIARRAEEGDE